MLQACPEVRKVCQHPLRDIPLLDSLYRKVKISVSESWQHEKEPSQLPQDIEPEEIEFEEISSPIRRHEDSQKTPQTHVPNKSYERLTKSKSSRKRPNSDHWDRITSTLENQERFWSMAQQNI